MSNQLRQFALGRKEAADYVTGDLLSEFSPATPPPAQPQAYPVGQPISDEDMMMGAMAASPATPALIESAASQGLPVEEMLGGLLDDMYGPETTDADNKKLRSQMMLRGLGLGLSQLSQGNQIDLTTVAEQHNRDKQQRAQTRLARVKSQAAAEMLLEQGGSPEMAKAIATGAISYGDFLTKTQMDRAEARAAAAVAREAEQNGALADSLKEMGASDVLVNAAENGIFSKLMTARTQMATLEQTEQAAADRSAVLAYYMDVFGGDLGKARAAMSGAVTEANSILTQEANLEILNQSIVDKEAAAAGRVATIETLSQDTQSTRNQLAAEYMAGDPSLNVSDAIAAADASLSPLNASGTQVEGLANFLVTNGSTPSIARNIAYASMYPGQQSEYQDTMDLIRTIHPDFNEQQIAAMTFDVEHGSGGLSASEEAISQWMELDHPDEDRKLNRQEAITMQRAVKVTEGGGVMNALTGLSGGLDTGGTTGTSLENAGVTTIPANVPAYDVAMDATGPQNAVSRLIANGLNIVAGIEFTPEQTNRFLAKDKVNQLQAELVRALQQNARFPEGEAKRIAEEYQLSTAVLKGEERLRAEMTAVDTSVSRRIKNTLADLANAKTQNEEEQYRSMLNALVDFRTGLGVPHVLSADPSEASRQLDTLGPGARVFNPETETYFYWYGD